MMSPKRPGLRLDDQICFALYAATNAVTRAYKPLLAELGLTYPQYLVMLALWQDSAMAGTDLAARLEVGPSAVTPLVDRLESAGFVTRVRAADRRVVMVAPTAAGLALEEKAVKAQRAVVRRTGLGARPLADLRRELRALADRVVAPDPSSRGAGRETRA
ncbi:DNA-binding transcriptional regulator, MarR family [Methylobacterium phyllostachyos]|uniref:DNA-binding transcriptional regulator, MarR family n=1 Tax=Methylobacterium phyllostachyos TaxID=582672 RepID=A0A1G9WWW7_9HYPH|nr:MarR family transcriptional regulator [Methylobacterium phyllostachyos]SDM88967.1 DNA-binding transcriptional regulator, MarR family [Methylobacterium phyllostachyos]